MNRSIATNVILAVIGITLLVGVAGYFVYHRLERIDDTSVYDANTYEDIGKQGVENSLFCLAIEHNPDVPLGEEFIINSDEAYKKLLDLAYFYGAPNCEKYGLPAIDFSQKTLLGKKVSGGGCSTEFKKDIYKDVINKGVYYNIRVMSEGYCDSLQKSMNWILVHKIPSDHNVSFKITK